MVDGIRHCLGARTSGNSDLRLVAVSLPVLAGLMGCDTVSYHAGHPPPDAHLSVSEVSIEAKWDSSGLTRRISWVSSWNIDSVDFRQRKYRIGTMFERLVPEWNPGPRSIAISDRLGTRRDTLLCDTGDCRWMSPKVVVLAEIDSGHFLSVAESSLVETTGGFW